MGSNRIVKVKTHDGKGNRKSLAKEAKRNNKNNSAAIKIDRDDGSEYQKGFDGNPSSSSSFSSSSSSPSCLTKVEKEKLIQEVHGYVPFDKRQKVFDDLPGLMEDVYQLSTTKECIKGSDNSKTINYKSDFYTEQISAYSRDVMDLYVDELDALRSDPLYEGDENDIQTIITSCGLPILLQHVNDKTSVENGNFLHSMVNAKTGSGKIESRIGNRSIHQIIKQNL